ncbi:MAG: hypothetical protein N3F64_02375 [Nitrososphaeria archaeon]|nr:hypothetical protein [Nitrososphaeria archaeon]
MVEVFEKCLVIGLSLMLAASLYNPILNIVTYVYNSVSDDQLNILAKDFARLIERSHAFKGTYYLSYVVSKDFNIFFENGILKIFYDDKIVNVGVYDFDIIVDDLRKESNFVRIAVIGKDDAVFIVIEDAF